MFPAARCCLRLRSAASSSVCRLELSAARYLRTSSTLHNEPLPSPALDDAPKVYPPKIQQLVDQIASLTLLEVCDLNELLKKTLKIQDVGVMPMGTMMPGPVGASAPTQGTEEEAAPAKKEKTHFTAKKMVESLPQEIKANVAKEEAEKMKAALEAAGGKVVLE